MNAAGRNRGIWTLQNERKTPSRTQKHFLITFLGEGVAGGDVFMVSLHQIKMSAPVGK